MLAFVFFCMLAISTVNGFKIIRLAPLRLSAKDVIDEQKASSAFDKLIISIMESVPLILSPAKEIDPNKVVSDVAPFSTPTDAEGWGRRTHESDKKNFHDMEVAESFVKKFGGQSATIILTLVEATGRLSICI